MMKLRFDKRLDEGMMKVYCIDYHIIEKVLINSSEISSLRLLWETAMTLQVETEHTGHADISSRKRRSRQAVHSVFQAFGVFRHSGAVQVCFRRNQVQSAAPMGSHDRLQVQGQKETADAGTVRIFPQAGKYHSLLGDFPHASLRVR